MSDSTRKQIVGDLRESETLVTEAQLIIWSALMWSLGVLTGIGWLLWT